ncbi:dihydroorotase, mitochondrial-like [Chenopodium quinoa]|uniref:dihydroorotase, mitochondrial-like n=1 Tax=Chenopodium quinoa TaxID=63459 RepID=UPI000B76FDFC|nr:dihydroorotase, mitochondrial-like [Chenopodium quinoa]
MVSDRQEVSAYLGGVSRSWSSLVVVPFCSRDQGIVAATVTSQPLALKRNSLFQRGLQPHNYSLPVLQKRLPIALVSAATNGSKNIILD